MITNAQRPSARFAPAAGLWRAAAVLALALTGLGLSACVGAGPPIALAPSVDMSRMYAGWYIVATIPNPFERGMVEPYDIYSKAADGGIKEDFYVRRGSFCAPRHHLTARDWVRPGTGNAHWRAQPIWPLNLPFLILYVDPDYRYVMFGEQNRAIGWIFARSPQIPEGDYEALLDRFSALGYDKSRFRKVIQSPDQIGKPGFWSDGITPTPAANP